MIVYGDHRRRLDPREELDRLEAALQALPDAPAGLRRHAALTSAFVDAAALAQALIDAEAAATGLDTPTPLHLAAAGVLLELACAVDASWRAGATGGDRAPSLAALARLAPLGPVDAKLAEGFAFYALYPEGHAGAARRLGLDGEARVLGLRSIGLALAAMAAAAAGAPAPLSARPVGHPFDRRLALDPAFRARLATDAGRVWAVADEGPGLSGSSFAAALDALEAAGVAPDRIALLPGHAGPPGGRAGPERRARYAAARRAAVDLDALAISPRLNGGGSPLAAWAQDLTGPPLAPLEELSGGAWRAHLLAGGAAWPPVDPAREGRKFRLRAEHGVFRLKFAGLGAEGEAKLVRAQALHAAGFAAPALGLRHGFLVEPWLEGARPLDDTPPDRAVAAARIAPYLRLRARAFPAQAWEGADLPTLWAMTRANAEEALDARAAARLDGWRGRLDALARGSRRIHVDARLHLWEWLRLPDGRVLKTDALDHARAHDLIGAQDVAWDVAGAAVELRLEPGAETALAAALETPPPRLAFHRLAYLAFQLGLWDQAARSQAGEDARTAETLREGYADRLDRALYGPPED